MPPIIPISPVYSVVPPFLAQLDKVPASFLQQFLLVIVGILGGAAAVATVYGVIAKRRGSVQLDPPLPKPPFDIHTVPDAVTDRACHERHADVSRRLLSQDDEFKQLWERIRADKESADASARARSAGIYSKIDEVRKELAAANTSLRTEIMAGFKDVERTIGRLEGKLEKK
jgi:hypothetical protein